MSSSLEKIPQNPPISPALRPETIRHPDKRSKLENDATCGLAEALGRHNGSDAGPLYASILSTFEFEG